MKAKIFILIPFIFLACKEIDIEQVAKEDNLSGENKDYLIACEKYDNAKSCNAIAEAYRRGEGAVKNEDKALLYYEKACNLAIKLDPNELEAIEMEKYFSPCWDAGYGYRKKLKRGIKDSRYEDKALEFYKKDCLNAFGGSVCASVAAIYEDKHIYNKAKEYYLRHCLKEDACMGRGDKYIEILRKE